LIADGDGAGLSGLLGAARSGVLEAAVGETGTRGAVSRSWEVVRVPPRARMLRRRREAGSMSTTEVVWGWVGVWNWEGGRVVRVERRRDWVRGEGMEGMGGRCAEEAFARGWVSLLAAVVEVEVVGRYGVEVEAERVGVDAQQPCVSRLAMP